MQRLEKSSNLAGGIQRKNLAKRLSPVAVAVFLFAGDLGVCFIEFLEKEYGVISEAVFASRLFCQDTLCEIGDNSKDAALPCDRGIADKPRAPLLALFSFHLAQKFARAIFVRCIRPGISRGMNSRSAAESGHYQARIVRENCFVREAAVMLRFSCGILCKCRRRFFESWKRAEMWNQIELDFSTGGELAVFAQLAWIRGREKKLHGN